MRPIPRPSGELFTCELFTCDRPAELKNEKTRRVEDLRQINPSSTQGVHLHGTPEGNHISLPTGYSVVATGRDEDPLPHAFVASPTLNNLNPTSDPDLARQWHLNPREYLSQPQFKYPARQWNSIPSTDRAPSFFKSLAKGPILDSPEIVGGEPLVEALDSPEIVGGEPLVEAVVQKKESTMKSFTPGVCQYCRGKGFSGHKCQHYQQVNLLVRVSEEVVPEQGERFNHLITISYPFTHNLPKAIMPVDLDWSIDDKQAFIKEVNIWNRRVRHFTGFGNTPMVYPPKPVIEEIQKPAKESGDGRIAKMCLEMLNAMRSQPEYNYVAYRKGIGVVCNIRNEMVKVLRSMKPLQLDDVVIGHHKSLHCYFIWLMLEYSKFSSLDSDEPFALKFNNPIHRQLAEFNPLQFNVVYCSEEYTGYAVVLFTKDWNETNPYGEYIYGWLAKEEDYKSGDPAGRFLSEKGDLKAVDDLEHDLTTRVVKDKESVYALAMNDTGSLLVSSGIERVVCVWDPETGPKNMKMKHEVEEERNMLQMAEAVVEGLPNERHCFCFWHILKKLQENVGRKHEKEAIPLRFKDVVYDTVTLTAFEKEWVAVVEQYKLKDNEWFSALYSCRKQWAPGYVNHSFRAGISAIRKVEKPDPYLDGVVTTKSTLLVFLEQYEATLKRKREWEAYDDLHSYYSRLVLLSGLPFEEQLVELCTVPMFQAFQDEIKQLMHVLCEEIDRRGNSITNMARELIQGKKVDKDVWCNCRSLQQSHTEYCSHAIAVLKQENGLMLPTKYIFNRWKKDFRILHASACSSSVASERELGIYDDLYVCGHEYLEDIIDTGAIVVSLYVSFSITTIYGIAVAVLGKLSTIAIGLAIDAYGPISDNAGGIAEMAGMSHRILENALGGIYGVLNLKRGHMFDEMLRSGTPLYNKTLHDIFSAFGTILSCKVATYEMGQSKGFGFVQYEKEEAAQFAIKSLNGILINDTPVYVGPFICKQDRDNSVDKAKFNNIFVKNLSESTTKEDLVKFFGEYGNITSAVVMIGMDGKSRYSGFINFESPDDAARAVDELNGRKIDDKEGYVGRDQKKSERKMGLKRRFEQSMKEAADKYQGLNLYLKKLDDSIGDDHQRELFSNFGKITSCKVMHDQNGVAKSLAWLHFQLVRKPSMLLTEMKGKRIPGKTQISSKGICPELYSQTIKSWFPDFHT